MIAFVDNKNKFVSALQDIKGSLESFALLGVGKCDKMSRSRKKTLLKNVSLAIDGIDTNANGIRVVIVKTKD